MPGPTSDPSFDGVEDTLTTIERHWPELHRRIEDAVERIKAGSNLTGEGALTDTLQEARPEIDTRAAQVVAATAPRDRAPSEGRRKFLEIFLLGALSGAAGTILTLPLQIRLQERSTDRILSSAAIHEILNIHEDRSALAKMAETYTAAGRLNEASFVRSRLDHGSSYANTQHNLALLEHFLDGNDHDPTVKAFIGYRHAVDHRYIGLLDQSDRLAENIELRGLRNAKLLALLVDLRYSTSRLGRMLHLGQRPQLAGFGDAHRWDVQQYLGFDPAAPEREDVLSVAQAISCEAASHYGRYALMRIYSAGAEGEALDAFETLATVLSHVREHARQTGSDYAYGESWWPLANVALVALYRGWNRLSARSADLAMHGDGTYDPNLQSFLDAQRRRQTSPAFITFGLVQAVDAQLKSGGGAEALKTWVPLEGYASLRHHTLSRGLIAFTRALGGEAKPQDRAAGFARPEGADLLFACIGKVASRR